MEKEKGIFDLIMSSLWVQIGQDTTKRYFGANREAIKLWLPISYIFGAKAFLDMQRGVHY